MYGTAALGPVERTALTDLLFDEGVWPRTTRDAERVALFASKYQEGGEQALPPIAAIRYVDGLLCYDGWTRSEAARQAGLTHLDVSVITLDDDADPIASVFFLAVRASTGGHKELSRSERHAGIRRLIAETDLSDTDIAEIFGVSRQTVWRARQPRVPDATRAEDAGERYLAARTAKDIATSLFEAMERVYAARGLGLWDTLTGDHTGERLAEVLLRSFGDDALERAEDFRDWCDEAIAELLARGRS